MQCIPTTLLYLMVAGFYSLAAAEVAEHVDLGPAQTLLADQALGLRAFPDGRLSVLSAAQGVRVIFAAGVNSVLVEGPDMTRLNKVATVLERGKPGEFDNGYAGINSVVKVRNGDFAALYHAEDQEGMESVGSGIPGFYCRIALAVSHDEGVTFEKRGPVLSGSAAKKLGGLADQGVGEPWVLEEPSGKHLYAYYTSHERLPGRGVDICMARCRVEDALRPGEWKKFHEGAFEEPGLGGRDSPIMTGSADADAAMAQVVYSHAMGRFIMIFCLNAWREGAHAERSGIYVAFSADGIHWPKDRMQQIWKVPVIAQNGAGVAWHPTFVPSDSTGARGWLYYGYSKNWGWSDPAKPHYLMRRPIEFTAPAAK
jgi:hypothetical protein